MTDTLEVKWGKPRNTWIHGSMRIGTRKALVMFAPKRVRGKTYSTLSIIVPPTKKELEASFIYGGTKNYREVKLHSGLKPLIGKKVRIDGFPAGTLEKELRQGVPVSGWKNNYNMESLRSIVDTKDAEQIRIAKGGVTREQLAALNALSDAGKMDEFFKLLQETTGT